jgi:hypothetical protein
MQPRIICSSIYPEASGISAHTDPFHVAERVGLSEARSD